MIKNNQTKRLVTIDKLYYKAFLPRQKRDGEAYQYLGPLADLTGDLQPPRIKIGKRIVLESNFNKAESKKQEFVYKYDIYFGVYKIGLLHYRPNYNSFLKDEGVIGIQINNYTLYQDYCIEALRDLHQHAQIQFSHFTDLDIAIDTNENLIDKFDDYFNSTQVYLTKKVNVKFQKQTYPLTQCSHFTIYNKSLELKSENIYKPYIQSYFLQNGFKPADEIYRCELRLNRKVLTKDYPVVTNN